MKNFAVLTTIVLSLLTGCICFDCGYTPNQDIKRYSYSENDKYPVTYSVKIYKARNDILADPDVDDLCKKIEERLKESNLFSDVSYVSQRENDGYHIDFNFHLGGTDMETSFALGLVAGYTFLTVPVCEDIFLDLRTTVYANQKAVFSVCSAEKGRCLIWLPCAPIGLFANVFVYMHSIENSVINDAINNISQEHIQRYLEN